MVEEDLVEAAKGFVAEGGGGGDVEKDFRFKQNRPSYWLTWFSWVFCLFSGIEMLSLGSFKTGGILLVGLFFYDIFWVFFTPVMVSVAKSFDAPIKLLFPTTDAARPYSMLGLGDIVIPVSICRSLWLYSEDLALFEYYMEDGNLKLLLLCVLM
ncbi:hypothetical protein MKW92_019944 [Papaver armeniacum]|nr:hypothetical protein MKW92_019944 [Papaver armeniacum]